MMDVQVWIKILLSVMNLSLTATQLDLTSSTGDGAACSNDVVVFTCSVNGGVLQWLMDPPPGYVVSAQVRQIIFSTTVIEMPSGVEGFMFQPNRTDTSNGIITSILTTITEVSLLNGSVITCSNGNGISESRTITIAVSPTSPFTAMVASQQNGVNFSLVTLVWDPPSSTGGVYVLTISPTPLSGSPVTIETTFVHITVSYNTPYNVTIRAENCAGMSNVSMLFTIPSIVACPSSLSATSGVVNIHTPIAPTVHSTLTFTCSDTNHMVTSTCGSDAQWNPDPENFMCPTIVNCSLPEEPSNGIVVDYERLNETVLEGTVLTYQCDNGLSLTGPNNITCTNPGVWSTEPDTIMCVLMIEGGSATGIGPIVGGVIGSLFVALIVLILIVVITKKYKNINQLSGNKGKKNPTGPVYEEVGLAIPPRTQDIQVESNEAYGQTVKGNIELQSNQAYECIS